MPHVAALYRYPVKGFTPEPRESLSVLPSTGPNDGGRVLYDRAFAFRLADAPAPNESGWMPKSNYVVLAHTPGLARVELRFDEARRSLQIAFPGKSEIAERLDSAGRARLCEAVAGYCLSLPDSPLRGHPEKLPLSLVGDLQHDHFHDNAAGRVSLHSRASLRALGETLYDPGLDERRFRSNISIEGVPEWEEFSWIGKKLRIGEAVFSVVKTSTRCLATHANPATGQRDCDIMNTLTRTFGHEKPQFAVSMNVIEPGEIRLDDAVTVLPV